MKKIQFILMVLIVLNSCKKTEPSPIGTHEIITELFSGDLAYETTAYVEKYWRIVGNRGFDSSIYKIKDELEKSGYVNEDGAPANTRLTYRIEKRPLRSPTWEPIDATLTFADEIEPLLEFSSNRNMVAINSFSTPDEGVTAEVIYIEDIAKLKDAAINDKIVFVETSPGRVFEQAVKKGGALGIISYSNPEYLQPKKNTTSIQFRGIPYDEEQKSWAIALSYAAKERLKKKLADGEVKLKVQIETNIYPSEELTIVADIKGSETPEERLVFSAHVQEPGANDNASGVGVAVEMAGVMAKLIEENQVDIKRSLTFLWGDEIVSTDRYVKEDSVRASKIKWGISLDMVGQNTALTGGSFLIEKMPDPSAIWTRGNDKHTEWGGYRMQLDHMMPHYLNDYLIEKFKTQGDRANWETNNNPFEGGSDHVPFLRAGIPSVLFWHFTDQFYHTDNDRLDKVSQETLRNVGITSLESALELLNADENTAKEIIALIRVKGEKRLQEELAQSRLALEAGATMLTQDSIVKAWQDWYVKALSSTYDLVRDTSTIHEEVKMAQGKIDRFSKEVLDKLSNE